MTEAEKDALHDQLTRLSDEIGELYHRAGREFDLPSMSGVYAANMPEGQRWSSPYSPDEISSYVSNRIDTIVDAVSLTGQDETGGAA